MAISINLAGFLPMAQTGSFFTDTEPSTGNKFVADPFGFSVQAADFSGAVSDSQAAQLSVMLIPENTDDFDLTVSSLNFSGDLCPKLDLSLDSDTISSGAQDLQTFAYKIGSFMSADGTWVIKASLKPEAIDWQGQSCGLDLNFFGQQTGGGFWDQQTVSATVNAESLQIVDETVDSGDATDTANMIVDTNTTANAGSSGTAGTSPAATATDTTTAIAGATTLGNEQNITAPVDDTDSNSQTSTNADTLQENTPSTAGDSSQSPAPSDQAADATEVSGAANSDTPTDSTAANPATQTDQTSPANSTTDNNLTTPSTAPADTPSTPATTSAPAETPVPSVDIPATPAAAADSGVQTPAAPAVTDTAN